MTDEKVKREIGCLKIYAVLSSLMLIALVFLAAQQGSKRAKFEEIDVERINIVEKDGKWRLVIANRERSPGPIIGGHYLKTREGQRPGLIFFNDKGDECGGMTWSSREQDGRVRANSGLMFDQYNQDQTVGITYSQAGEERTSGLMVWERPLTPLADFARELDRIEQMKEGPEKNEALKKLREEAAQSGLAGVTRVFVGRSVKSDAVVRLSDTKGRPRILIYVDSADNPRMEFLDEEGKAFLKFPDDWPPKKDK